MAEPNPSSHEELLEHALAGDEEAMRDLVDWITPIAQARVARVYFRFVQDFRPPETREAIRDLTQEIFVVLFKDQAKTLRRWDPTLGLSLANYVGIVAERRTISSLRRARRNPAGEALYPAGNCATQDPDPEGAAVASDLWRKLLTLCKEQFSPRQWYLFELLFVRELSVDEIRGKTGMGRDAIYQARSRLRRHARQILQEHGSSPLPQAHRRVAAERWHRE